MRNRSGPVTIDQATDAWRKVGVRLPRRGASRALQSLTAREIVVGSEAYSFTIDLQRLWVERHRRLEWVKDELSETIQQWS
jgi:hypothetical protein